MHLQLKPDKPRFVAGSIDQQTERRMSPDVNDPGYRAVSFDDLRIAYKQQVEALIDSDLLLVETIFDTKAALFAIEEVKDERSIDIQSWCQERLRMRQKNTFRSNRRGFLISISHISSVKCWFQLCLRC
jgi:5-methyltetrahydrofolate--homocysteine methyltransferase